MIAGRSHLHGAPHLLLPLHVSKVEHTVNGGDEVCLRGVVAHHLQRPGAGDEGEHLRERVGGVDGQPVNDCRLPRIGTRDDDGAEAIPHRIDRHREDAVDRLYPTVEGELAHHHHALQRG